MSRIAYVNGRYIEHAAAGVSIDDRALYFGDGVYEVCEVRGGALIDEARHLGRLARSLEATRIAWPIGAAALRGVLREVVRRNRVSDGIVYLQISRGVARRDHGFPRPGTKPTLTVTAKSLDSRLGEANAARGVKVITLPDPRWARHQDVAIGAERSGETDRARGGRP
jgi:D-alanine transaminase